MIPALRAHGWEHQLAEPADLRDAVVGVSAEALAGLSPAELVARIGPTAQRRYIVVFDGPARTTSSKLDNGLLRRRIVRALVDADIPFVVAPALAAAQLAHMHAENLISHVFGCEEAWLWAYVPLVLDIFAAQPQMLRRSALLAQLRLPPSSFVELAVGLGKNAVTNDVFPPLDFSTPPTLDAVLRSALQLGGPPPTLSESEPVVSLYRAALALQDPAYLASLQRALTFVYRQPVLQLDGTVKLLNLVHKPLPKDLTDVIGCQLSPVMLSYVTRGLLGPELLKAMVWGRYAEPAPSGPALGAAYTTLQTALSPIRQQAYALLVSTAHRYFQMREVVVQIPGASNFSKAVQPQRPDLSTEPQAATEQTVVSDAVKHLQALVGLQNTSLLDLAQEFTQQHTSDASKLPASALVQTTAIVFRQLVEVAVFWLIVMKDLHLDLKKIVLALPFDQQ